MSASAPFTIGTAGHVDHGKTALVAALTGVDTDRLPEEKQRGLTIALGYAPLLLPGGRSASVVDVPGHERFVRTMVAGASGIDLFLMVIAADDGPMPQTVEHARVLRALDVATGVVAITKTDLADPAAAAEGATRLLPGTPLVPCCARTGQGLAELREALARSAAALPGRASVPGPARLHIDRVFTVPGRGTVVTGTLWSGAIATGDELELTPSRARVRVRGVQVHDRTLAIAAAGQRVAVNLASTRAASVERGEVLGTPGAFAARQTLDCALTLREARHGQRVQVLHGTRAVAARLAELGDGLHQLRLEQPLLAEDGDRLVVRRLAPPDTLGGGTVLDAHARRHGRGDAVLARLRRRRAGEREPERPVAVSAPARPAPVEVAGEEELLELERRVLEAGTALLSEAQLAASAAALAGLRRRGRVLRVSGRLYGHARVVAAAREQIVAIVERDGAATLAGVRDELGLSRKTAQALLEHLDATRVLRRLPDDRRVLAGRARAGEMR